MQAITTNTAPDTIGQYSQAVRAAGFVFLSGQIGLDPATGNLVAGGVAVEAERVMDNLSEVLKAAGLTFDHVVKMTIYLVDIADFATVNEIYGKRLGRVLPARATVQVAGLPRGARVEIDAIASTPTLP
jgi:2-iminobutanoate/2-iminopropanoate deaminase